MRQPDLPPPAQTRPRGCPRPSVLEWGRLAKRLQKPNQKATSEFNGIPAIGLFHDRAFTQDFRLKG
jgi:hypothetical protein